MCSRWQQWVCRMEIGVGGIGMKVACFKSDAPRGTQKRTVPLRAIRNGMFLIKAT